MIFFVLSAEFYLTFYGISDFFAINIFMLFVMLLLNFLFELKINLNAIKLFTF